MELLITDKELDTIISAMRIGGDVALYQKLLRIKDHRMSKKGDQNTQKEFGFVL